VRRQTYRALPPAISAPQASTRQQQHNTRGRPTTTKATTATNNKTTKQQGSSNQQQTNKTTEAPVGVQTGHGALREGFQQEIIDQPRLTKRPAIPS